MSYLYNKGKIYPLISNNFNGVNSNADNSKFDVLKNVLLDIKVIAANKGCYYKLDWQRVYKCLVSNSNIQCDSVVNFGYSVEIPSELIYNVAIKSGGGYAITNVRNISNINATWPSGQILLSIQQSF